jgi:plasmid stabilization system protein ParE
MVFEINWTERSVVSYGENIDYLRKEWSENEVQTFADEIIKRLETLAAQPYIGMAKSDKESNIRQIVINKRIVLIYQIKPLKQRIDLLRFWNTYRNPQRLKEK